MTGERCLAAALSYIHVRGMSMNWLFTFHVKVKPGFPRICMYGNEMCMELNRMI